MLIVFSGGGIARSGDGCKTVQTGTQLPARRSLAARLLEEIDAIDVQGDHPAGIKTPCGLRRINGDHEVIVRRQCDIQRLTLCCPCGRRNGRRSIGRRINRSHFRNAVGVFGRGVAGQIGHRRIADDHAIGTAIRTQDRQRVGQRIGLRDTQRSEQAAKLAIPAVTVTSPTPSPICSSNR